MKKNSHSPSKLNQDYHQEIVPMVAMIDTNVKHLITMSA